MTPAFASARASAASASSIACTHPRPLTTSSSGRGTKSATNNKEGVFLQPDVERLRLGAVELDARVNLLQQAAGEDLHVDMRHLAEGERVAAVAVGAAPPPAGGGRPDLDQRVRHAGAGTVEHAPLEPDRAVGTRMVAQPEREERPHRLGRRGAHSNGLERRTMSKR